MAVKKKPAAKPKVPAKKKVVAKAKPVAKKKASVKRKAAKKVPAKPNAARASGFQLGNQFWNMRASTGRNPVYASGEELWAACCEYFEYVTDNPLMEMQAFAYQGVVTREAMPKVQAMTKAALYVFLGIDRGTWNNYAVKDEYKEVVEKVENIIWTQKFTYAAAGMLNQNIVCRELGLKEKSEQEVSGPGGGPVEHTVTRIELVPLEPNDNSTGKDTA